MLEPLKVQYAARIEELKYIGTVAQPIGDLSTYFCAQGPRKHQRPKERGWAIGVLPCSSTAGARVLCNCEAIITGRLIGILDAPFGNEIRCRIHHRIAVSLPGTFCCRPVDVDLIGILANNVDRRK